MIYSTTFLRFVYYSVISIHSLKNLCSTQSLNHNHSIQPSLHWYTQNLIPSTTTKLHRKEYKTSKVKLSLGIWSKVHKLDQANPLISLFVHLRCSHHWRTLSNLFWPYPIDFETSWNYQVNFYLNNVRNARKNHS